MTDPIDLDYCLRAFTSEEQLEQWYFCSHCKAKQPATKKLQIWKLPPILVSAALPTFLSLLYSLLVSPCL